VPLVLFQSNRVGAAELDNFAIDAHTHEPFALRFFNHVAKLANLIFDQRREQNDLAPRLVGQNLIDNLLGRLAKHRPARGWVVWLTDRGK
jgi:hypothetical protein